MSLLYHRLLDIAMKEEKQPPKGLYSSQTFVTQLPKDLFKKNSAIYSLGDLNPNTFCAMLLYLLAYR